MGACMKYKTQKTNFISKTKCLGIFIKKTPLLTIYRENKFGADYVQGEEKREAQLKIIKNYIYQFSCEDNVLAETPKFASKNPMVSRYTM